MVTHNSSNNFDVNVYYESNSQTTVSQTYDTYCNDVNNMISDQQLMSNTISLDQQLNASSPNHHDANDANDANYQQYNNQQTTIPDQPNVASPNHNQQYQQHDIVSPNSDECDTNYQQHNNAISNYSNNATISPGRQPTSDNNVTTSSDQQPTANSPNHNQQYQRHNVASPNHQQQYHNYQQPSGNNNHDSNNTNRNNHNQPSSSNNDSSPQFSSPQSGIFLNITINSPQTNFIIIPNMDIQQVLAFLNNPSGFQR